MNENRLALTPTLELHPNGRIGVFLAPMVDGASPIFSKHASSQELVQDKFPIRDELTRRGNLADPTRLLESPFTPTGQP